MTKQQEREKFLIDLWKDTDTQLFDEIRRSGKFLLWALYGWLAAVILAVTTVVGWTR